MNDDGERPYQYLNWSEGETPAWIVTALIIIAYFYLVLQ